MRYDQESIEERDAAVERLREFLRLDYMTGAQAAQRMGVRAETLYPWLQGKSRPKDVERIVAFLDSMPADRKGTMPTGYQYREYKNWRGIPKLCHPSTSAKTGTWPVTAKYGSGNRL